MHRSAGLTYGLGLQGLSHKPTPPLSGQWRRKRHKEGGKEVWAVSVLCDLEQISQPLWASVYCMNSVRSKASQLYKQNGSGRLRLPSAPHFIWENTQTVASQTTRGAASVTCASFSTRTHNCPASKPRGSSYLQRWLSCCLWSRLQLCSRSPPSACLNFLGGKLSSQFLCT